MDLVATTQPHFVPGYTGYCPQYIYRLGDTYGSLTHKLLIDPCVSHAENLILSNRNQDDFQVDRPTLREIDLVRAHEKSGDPIYKHPTIPGYEGFIPLLNSKVGARYSVTATEGIAEFEKHMLALRCEAKKLKHRSAIQDATTSGRSMGERSLQTNDFRLPLSEVRPEAEGISRNKLATQIPVAPPIPYSKDYPPQFMEDDDPNKYMTQGFDGHIPFAWPLFGQGNKPLTNGALCDFTNNYHHRRTTEWAPISNSTVGGSSTATGPNFEVYLKTTGLVPSYSGHVPGYLFRFGHTFGSDTVDAKQWLRN